MRSAIERCARRLASEALHLARRVRPAEPGCARVIYYHRIDDEQHRSCVTPRAFAEQMDLLATEGFNVIPLVAMRDALDAGRPFPERTVAITFDDGFADNYTNAFPVLSRRSLPATVFLAAGFIGGDELPVLRDRSGLRPLSWEQAGEMSRSGIDLGAHTVTHRSLTTLDATAAREEIEGSRALIEEHTGVRAETFCYPRGHVDDAVRGQVRSAGYRIACTTLPGVVSPATEPFSLRRTFVARDDTLHDFRRKLDGSFDLLHAARQRFAGNSPTPA